MDVRRGKSAEELGIDIPASKEYSSRDFKVRSCPACKELGKRRPNDSSLSVNADKKIANCKKCGTVFSWGTGARPSSNDKIVYDLPKDVLKPAGKEVMKWLNDRGITDEKIINATIKQKMFGGVPWVAFPYYKIVDDKPVLINAKYRSTTDKKFSQEKNGEPSLWLSHMAQGAKNLIITEGEPDAVAIMQSLGVDYMKEKSFMVLSINGGAINETDKDIDGKLRGFSNSYESTVAKADVVILACDSDPQGQRLKEELKKRIDKEVRVMRFGEFKDANELLNEKGSDAVIKSVESAEIELPDGVSRLEDFSDKMWSQYNNGLNKGTSTYFDEVDKIWRWRTGEVNVISGYANEGKTTLFLHLAMVACVFEPDRVFLVFSPENIPQEEFYEELIHSFIGLPSDIDLKNRMTPDQFQEGMDFMNKHFLLLYPTQKNDAGNEEENFTVSTIEAKIIETKRTDNITDVIIDPYNMIEHDFRISDREDLYISKFMTRLKRISLRCDISVSLIAHQVTPRPDHKTGNYPRPSMYTIKGGGTFADKADNVIMMWRPYRRKQDFDNLFDEHKKFAEGMLNEASKMMILSSLILMESEKIKKQKLVAKPGESALLYDYRSARFMALNGVDDVVGSTPLTSINMIPYGEVVAETEKEEYNVKTEAFHDPVEYDDGDVPF